MENKALEGLVIINGRDIWKEFGVFLTEERRGGRENLAAIMAPAKTKGHVGVNIRERDGVKYSRVLSVANEERDVTLHVALVAGTQAEWLARYRAFISFLKKGDGGWLTVALPELALSMRMFYVSSGSYKPLTYLWREGLQASRFKVTLREPEPSF